MSHPSDDRELWYELRAWFRDARRNWPWRQHRTPYRSWVAEVMSQQTPLAVVAPAFEAFMAELPDVASLASCSDDNLSRLWSGLGYYARVRNLRRGARHISQVHDGQFPRTFSEWLEVPGCGPYTAAVLASLHGGQRTACIDGNVVRVVSRLLDLRDETHTPAGKKAIAEFLDREIGLAADPGEFNESLMELGQCVCRKTSPQCDTCPLRERCIARLSGAVEKSPPPRPRRTKEQTLVTLLVVQRPTGDIAWVQRSAGLLSHTIGLPILSSDQARAALRRFEEGRATAVVCAERLRHTITHHAICATVYTVSLPHVEGDSLTRSALDIDKIEWRPALEAVRAVSSSLDRKALLAASVRP